MALEYHTVKFTNDAQGIEQKNAYARELTERGWHIASELIEPGHIKGGEACCGFALCMPLAFLAGRTPGFIEITFAREFANCPSCGFRLPVDACFCRQCGTTLRAARSSPTTALSAPPDTCQQCGAPVSAKAMFCGACGTRLAHNPPNGGKPEHEGR